MESVSARPRPRQAATFVRCHRLPGPRQRYLALGRPAAVGGVLPAGPARARRRAGGHSASSASASDRLSSLPGDILYSSVEIGGRTAMRVLVAISDTRNTPIPPSSTDTSTIHGGCSLPARKNLGSDLSERPGCASEGHFRGVAPAPPVLRSRGPTRPGNINNLLLGNQLARSRLLRSDLPSRPGGRAPGHFPRSTRNLPFGMPDHSPILGERTTWTTRQATAAPDGSRA